MKNEDIEFIKQYVMKNDRYSFVINDHYIIPSNIRSYSGNYINIRSTVENSKLNGNSKYVRSFRKDFINLRDSVDKSMKKYFEFIQEFPVPIEDLNLWNNLLLREGLSLTDNSEFFNRRFFLLDFLLYYPGIVVEVDSDFHDHKQRRLYDQVRDKYLKIKYGLETYRVEKYGDTQITDTYHIGQIKDIVLQKVDRYDYNKSRYYLDFSNTIINNFISDYRGTLEVIDKIRSYLGDLFRYYNTIVLTKLDLKIIDTYNFTTGLRKDQEKLYLDTVSMVLQEVYSKELYIHQTEEYSLYDVLRVIDLIKSRSFTWFDFEGQMVKEWLICLIGEYPPSSYTAESTPENLRISIQAGDGNIREFISILISKGIISSV